ncbi:hypothetical protein D3C77_68040 [compost metagenome]
MLPRLSKPVFELIAVTTQVLNSNLAQILRLIQGLQQDQYRQGVRGLSLRSILQCLWGRTVHWSSLECCFPNDNY